MSRRASQPDFGVWRFIFQVVDHFHWNQVLVLEIHELFLVLE